MKTTGYASGTLGEVRAEQHLAAQGFEILAHNYRIPGAEIDLIARKGELLVFAEVKLRKRGAAYGRQSQGQPNLCLSFLMLQMLCTCCSGGSMCYYPLCCCI